MRASLWGSAKDPVNKRNYGPGQHGRTPSRRVSNFNRQNAAQRAFRSYYNIGKRQFSNIFYRAYKGKGNTNDNLVALLERRLVSVLYRSGLVPTIFAAKQVVSHKHVTVNDEVVNISSYTLKEGDVVKMRQKSLKIPFVANPVQGASDAPGYLEVDSEKKSVKLLVYPKFSDVPYPAIMEPNLVTEYFSSKI